jgi:tRNA acetyltransferase TAN1
LYPSSAPKEEKEENKDGEEEEEDIEAMIAKEVATMSNKQPKSQKRFANIQTDTDCGNANYIYER